MKSKEEESKEIAQKQIEEQTKSTGITKATTLNNTYSTELRDEEVDELEKVIRSSVIYNVTDEEEPPALFAIQGVDVLAKQTVNIITAQKKSGKSNFAGLLMSASIAVDHKVLNGAVQSKLGKLKILYVDTEQPKRDARRTMKRMMKTAGYDYDEEWTNHNIWALSVKDYNEATRIRTISYVANKEKPQMIIIDGIADLIPSVNDEEKSKDIMSYLDGLACVNNCAIVGMLHLNYNSDKIGGWTGTIAGKKFTDCFTIKKKSKVGTCTFMVKHEGRGESAPDLNFKITHPVDDKIGWWESTDDTVSVYTKEDEEEMRLRTIMESAPVPCNNKELVKWYMNKVHCKKSKADKDLKKCKDEYKIFITRKEGKSSVWYKNTGEKDHEQ